MDSLNPNVRLRALREFRDWRREERRRPGPPRISSFEPHHAISVRAPDLLLTAKYFPVQLEYIGPLPRRIHNPLDPIVFHPATNVNQGRRAREENAFTSIAAVPSTMAISDQAFAALGALPRTTAHDFWNYLHAVQAWPGETLLRVMTGVDKEDDTASLQRAIVMATTVFPKQNGRARKIERYFLTRRYLPDMNTWPLDGPFALNALTAQGTPQWARDLVDVLRGDSDRAIRHRLIEYKYTYGRHQDPPVLNVESDSDDDDDDDHHHHHHQLRHATTLRKAYDFLPRRGIEDESIEGVIRIYFTLADVATIAQDSRVCPICLDRYDWDADLLASRYFPPDEDDRACPAVLLRCNHYMCRTCLVRQLSTRGPEARCPFCNRPILGEHAQNQLRFNVYRNPNGNPNNPHDQYVFRADESRWSREEDIQRSMSDLDRRLATDEAVKDFFIPTYNPHMLFDLWLDIVNMDDTYPDSPAHRYTLAPEWRTVVMHTWRAFSNLDDDGEGMRSRAMFEQLKDAMTAALRIEMRPRQTFYTNQLRNTPPTNLLAARKMRVWPSGMEAFWSRNMSRLIQYVRIRRCECRVEGTYSQWHTGPNPWHVDRAPGNMSWRQVMNKWAKHWHGDREYYSRQVYDIMMNRDGATYGDLWRI